MMHDIQMAKELGMDGVVLGVLEKEGQVNKSIVAELVGLARPLQVTFHRAFDLTPDPMESLHTLIEFGIDRLLTSGQHHTAYHGRNIIKTLVEFAGDKIMVMPGAGINEENVVEILSTTGAREFHVSASGVRSSAMKFQKSDVLMGDDASEYTVDIADGTRIGRFRQLVEQFSAAK
jgi:copper homeostasis protein